MKRKSLWLGLLMAVLMVGGSMPGWAQDKTVKFRLTASLPSLDWGATTNIRDMKVWHQMYEGLYGLDEATKNYYPELAKKIDLSKNGLVYTFTLRPGVKFQNGEPLKASDVVFSYNRAMKNPSFNYVLSHIANVAAVNDSTVKITLHNPYSPVWYTFSCIKITSEKEVTSQGSKFGTILSKAGTGPYFASSYTIASGLKLEAFKGYWRGVPAIKSVEYIVIPDDTSALIAFQNHEIDYLEDVPATAWKQVSAFAAPNAKMVKGNNVMFMAVNYLSSAHKVLANQKVREAMFYAVNRKDINDAVCEGYGTEDAQYMPPEYVIASPVSGFKTYPFNPGLSKKLLAEAGYPNGVDVGTILVYGTATSFNAKMGQVLQANLAEVGIKAEVYVAEMAIITPKIYNLDYDVCVFNGVGNCDFDNIGMRVSSKAQGMYVIKYKDGPFNWQRIEELLDLGASTSDIVKRTTYYTELWSIVMDSATMLPCIHRPVGIVWSKNLDIGKPVPTYYKIRTFAMK